MLAVDLPYGGSELNQDREQNPESEKLPVGQKFFLRLHCPVKCQAMKLELLKFS